MDETDSDAYALRAGVIAGYDAGRFLPYLTAGYANLNIDNGTADVNDGGYYYGAGVDYAVTSNVRVGVEYLEHEFDNFNDSGNDLQSKHDFAESVLRILMTLRCASAQCERAPFGVPFLVSKYTISGLA